MSHRPNDLRDLLAVLSTSIETLESLYAKTSVPIPSLDDPHPHPSDGVVKGEEWMRAIWIIQAASEQMTRLVSEPKETILVVRLWLIKI